MIVYLTGVAILFVLTLARCLASAAVPAAAPLSYPPLETAPPAAAGFTPDQMATILSETGPNTPYVVVYHLTATTSAGTRIGAAPLEVAQTDLPRTPYVGVFHHLLNAARFQTYLAWSPDLATWHALGAVHAPASQPDLRVLSDDSVLYADEYKPAGRAFVQLRYYGTRAGRTGLQALLADPATPPTAAIILPGSADATQDGTPEFGRLSYGGTFAASRIEINYHYYWRGRRDLDGTGRLTDGTIWAGGPDTPTNTLVDRAGGVGKIGEREVFQVGPTVYELVEAQIRPASSEFGDWRLFLVDRTARRARMLHPALAGGAQSIGNPHVSFLTLPDGRPALALTCFVFNVDNGTTPTGGHLYVYPLP
jgi:hypothetical protein